MLTGYHLWLTWCYEFFFTLERILTLAIAYSQNFKVIPKYFRMYNSSVSLGHAPLKRTCAYPLRVASATDMQMPWPLMFFQ